MGIVVAWGWMYIYIQVSQYHFTDNQNIVDYKLFTNITELYPADSKSDDIANVDIYHQNSHQQINVHYSYVRPKIILANKYPLFYTIFIHFLVITLGAK